MNSLYMRSRALERRISDSENNLLADNFSSSFSGILVLNRS